MDSAPDRVTVVVKASNQQFDDQTVVCEPSWSVRKLKEHLQEVYPCKPRLDEQKLIYAGQLLTDKLILKDILRTYEGVHPPNHAMHLVYTPKTRQQLAGSGSSSKDKNSSVLADGLRHRNIQGAASSESASQSVHSTIPQMATGPASNCPNSLPPGGNNVPGLNFSQATNEYLVAQQLAMQNWMQQAYIQYMNQYMNLLSIGVRPESVYMQNQPHAATANSNLGIPQMPYLPQNIPFANTNTANLPSSSIPPNQVAAANPESEDTSPQAVPVPPAEQPQQPQNEHPQPRFPNIVQEELPENRDWLDMFYSFSRLLVLLTLVYFYSSPLRCLVVLFIGLAIYFYHVGFFRNAAEANNNNRGREENAQQQAIQQEVLNPAQPGNNQNGEVENQQQPDTEEAATAEVEESTVSATTPVVESQNNGTSVIAFLRTFVVSFFVSLLPETPAL